MYDRLAIAPGRTLQCRGWQPARISKRTRPSSHPPHVPQASLPDGAVISLIVQLWHLVMLSVLTSMEPPPGVTPVVLIPSLAKSAALIQICAAVPKFQPA